MIQYPAFQAKDWQIGSGLTEATCKTLTAGLKGSGMRWDSDNAEAGRIRGWEGHAAPQVGGFFSHVLNPVNSRSQILTNAGD
jgi:hypothetical protein